MQTRCLTSSGHTPPPSAPSPSGSPLNKSLLLDRQLPWETRAFELEQGSDEFLLSSDADRHQQPPAECEAVCQVRALRLNCKTVTLASAASVCVRQQSRPSYQVHSDALARIVCSHCWSDTGLQHRSAWCSAVKRAHACGCGPVTWHVRAWNPSAASCRCSIMSVQSCLAQYCVACCSRLR
jgi:hypothetical protein